MDDSEIDLEPLRPGWGRCWQGGSADADVDKLPSPLVIYCMNAGEMDEQWIDHKTCFGVVAVEIDDSPQAILPEGVLRGLARAGAELLASGVNLYIHCAAGISRSSYMDIAIHCSALGEGYAAAFRAIAAQRAVAHPNPGFSEQLQKVFGP